MQGVSAVRGDCVHACVCAHRHAVANTFESFVIDDKLTNQPTESYITKLPYAESMVVPKSQLEPPKTLTYNVLTEAGEQNHSGYRIVFDVTNSFGYCMVVAKKDDDPRFVIGRGYHVDTHMWDGAEYNSFREYTEDEARVFRLRKGEEYDLPFRCACKAVDHIMGGTYFE